MFGLLFILLATVFLKDAPNLKFQPYPKRMRLGNLNGQWMWVPKYKEGESRASYKRRHIAMNKKSFRHKLSLVKWYLELRTLWRYPHYRRNKVTIMRAKYVALVPWRVDWSKAFITNTYFAPKEMGFRDYYIAKWVPDIRIQTPLRSINRQTVMMGIGVVLLLCGIPAMPMIGGVNVYFNTSGNDVTGDGSIGTPWKTEAKFNAVMAGYTADDIFYWEKSGDFRDSVNGGGDVIVMIKNGAMGTSGHVITMTGYGAGADPIVERIYGYSEYWTFIGIEVNNVDIAAQRCITFSDEATIGRGLSFIDCTMRNGANGMYIHGAGDKSDCLITGCTAYQGGTGAGFYFDSGTAVHYADISFYNNTIDNPGSDGFTIHETGSDTANYIEGPFVVHSISFTNLSSHTSELIDIVTGTFGEMYNIDVTFVDLGVSYGHSAGVNADTANGQWEIHHCIFDQPDTAQQTAINIAGRNLKLYNSLIISDGTRSVINLSDALFATNPAPGVNTQYSVDDIEIYYCTLIDNGITGYGLIYYLHDSATGFEVGAVTIQNCIFTSAEATMNTIMFFIGGTQAGSYPLNSNARVLNYNIYYDPNNAAEFGALTDVWSDLQTAGHEANGFEKNPNLVDRTGGTSGWPDDAYLASGNANANPITAGDFHDINGNATTGIDDDYIGSARGDDVGFYESLGVAYHAGKIVMNTIMNTQ